MKITRLRVYRKTLTCQRGSYAWGRGKVIASGSSAIVVVDTNAGISGCGEFCPCGDNYMQAHSEGTEGGRLYAADTPGIGVEPDDESLGDPLAVYP